MNAIRFEQAGNRPKNERVFLMSKHRVYRINRTIFHRNDYHTTIIMNRTVFRQHFRFNRATWIYENITGITYGELAKIAIVNTARVDQ